MMANNQSFQKNRIVIKDEPRDSTIWDLIQPKNTDIVIGSCYKSGTTLTQQIINLMVNGDDNFASIHDISPWIEEIFLTPPENKKSWIESLSSPRIFKSHLLFEALPYYPEWKYIYLARDGRDVGVSYYDHLRSFLPKYFHENLPENFGDFWDDWVETKEDKVEYWSYWKHIKSWWQVRNLPNVLLVHYQNLIYDKSQAIDRIYQFLNLDINQSKKEMILEKSSLEYMKLNWQKFQPVGVFQPNTFINKGVNGRWQNLLTAEQLKRYEIIISEELEPECANWVKNAGFLPAIK
ncbi:MAG: sulfotransferase domain-containing protein [Trichodesmium sp.]